MVMVIAAIIVLRIQFPPEKIKKLIETELTSALNNRPVSIESANLNILKGFVFDNITIYNPQPSDSGEHEADRVKFISIKKTYLNYSLLSLLRRNVKIRTIEINHPVIYYTSYQDKTNIDDLIAPSEADTVEIVEDTVKTAISLPISFQLNKFEFNHFDAFVSVMTDTSSLIAEIRDFSIHLSDLKVPRGAWSDIQDSIRAKIHIESPESEWKIKLTNPVLENPYQAETLFDLNIDLLVNGLGSIRAAGSTGMGEVIITENTISNKIPASKLFNVAFDVKMDAQQGNLDIDELNLRLADEQALSINGLARNLFDIPFIDLNVENSEIQLSRLFRTVESIAPSEYASTFAGIDIGGLLSFKNTTVTGTIDSSDTDKGLAFTTILDLKDFSLYYPQPATRIDSLSIHLEGRGKYNIAGLHDGHLKGALKLATLYSEINDTLKIDARDFTLNLNTAISPDYLPANVEIIAHLKHILGASAALNVNFESIQEFENYNGYASLKIQNFDLKNLPQSPGTGLLETQLTLRSHRLDSVLMNLTINSDSLYMPMESGEMVIPPLDINGIALLSTNQAFEDYSIRNFQITGNDFLKIGVHGTLEKFGENGFEAVIDSAVVKHRELFNFIPSVFKIGLEDLVVDGFSRATLRVDGEIPAGRDVILDASSKVSVFANVDYPAVPLTARGITATLKINSDGTKAQGDLWANLDSLTLHDVRKQAITNSLVQAQFHFPDFTRGIIDSVWIEAPDLKSRLTVSGLMDSLDAVPVITLDGKYSFNSGDPVMLIDDFDMDGQIESTINMYFKQPQLAVKGELFAGALNARFADMVSLHNISARIPFSQKVDIDQLLLLNEPTISPLFADKNALNYSLMRPYYLNTDAVDPYLNIKKIQMMEYEITDVEMDLHIGNGRIDISRMALKLYGGNMIGNMSLDLGNGQPDAVNYYMKANVSRLNSARLSPVGRGSARESELNLNMELNGAGIDFQKEIDVTGFLYITKIGSRFTDNVLSSLDPKGTDKSIQGTKRLLRWGYKPKLISFEIKHGNLYPSIHLTKGNFLTKLIPLNLSGGKIELARIPVKFFANMAMTQPQ